MNTQTLSTAASGDESHRKGFAPIATLLLLSPLVGEVLNGATKLSYIFVLVPEIMVWGVGALLIREMVRRWQGGWISVLSLGLALSVAEEFLIQQTSLAPLNWMGVATDNGRIWGVNLFYFLFMLGYESVWIVMIPIQVTELIFPSRRDQPWLRTRGLWIAGIVFSLGARIAWYLWIKQARPHAFHLPDYHVPLATTLVGGLAFLVCVFTGYALRNVRLRAPTLTRTAPRPWLVLVATPVIVFPWYLLMALLFIPRPVPLWSPVFAEVAWGVITILLIRRWAAASDWSDMHRWALAFGAMLFCMVAGFIGSSLWLRMDLVFKLSLNVIAVIGMLALAKRISRSAESRHES